MTKSLASRVIVALSVLAIACSGGTSAPTTTTGSATTVDPGPTIPITTPTTAVVAIPPTTDTLVVWVEDADLVAPVEERGTAYTAATGITVEVRVYAPPAEALPEGPTATTLLSALVLDQVDGAADLYLGPHTWAMTLAEAGRAEPVFLSDELAPSIVDSVSPRGYPLAVPLAINGVVQVRNRALMPEAPESVETISCPESVQCLLLPADGDADVHYPFLVAVGGYLFGLDPAGGHDTDDLGISSEESIAGAIIFDTLLEAGTVDAAANEGAVIADFVAGNAALAWVHASGLAAIEASDLDVAVETLPTIGGNPAVTAFRTLAAYVNPFGEGKSEALDFATNWLGDLNGSALVALAKGIAPVWSDAADPAMAAVVASAAAGHSLPIIDDIDRIWFEVSDAFRRIHIGTSPEDAMTGAVEDIR
ncbi:MAG: extracellular solute-binding protein [Acidimicrobiia bacterium]|nr:extracellular solute-binding protein [Acidimicrobiia bacterium]